MNLGPPAASPSSRRPHQSGRAVGVKAGVAVVVPVVWMIDTGADIGVVRKFIGDNFDLVATAASASPTTGGGGILVKTGLNAEFTAEDNAGSPHVMRASLPVGVKSNNAGSDIIGMDQLGSLAVEVAWEPRTHTGTLRIRTAVRAASVVPPSITTQNNSVPPPTITVHDTWVDVGGVRVEKRYWK